MLATKDHMMTPPYVRAGALASVFTAAPLPSICAPRREGGAGAHNESYCIASASHRFHPREVLVAEREGGGVSC